MTHARIKALPGLCQQLIGQRLGTHWYGHAGRALEDLLEQWGWPINRGQGPDILMFGLEVKTRDLGATSAQTVASMDIWDILNQIYDDSVVKQKFQQHLKIFTRSGVIQDAGIFDFGGDSVQNLIRQAYEHARQQLIESWEQEHDLVRTSKRGGFHGYFERCHADRKHNYSWRLNVRDMANLEYLSRTRIDEFFAFE